MKPYAPIRGRDLDGSYLTEPEHRTESRARRERNLAAGRCINDNARGTHGLATDGVRCRRCHLVYKLGAAKARETFEFHHWTPVMPADGANA